MSTKLVGQVWDCVLTSNERTVLQAFAEHANHSTLIARPGIGLVSWMTDLDPTTVRKIVRGFEAMGVLRMVEKARQHRATSYAIDLSPLARKVPYRADEDAYNQGGRGTRSEDDSRAGVAPGLNDIQGGSRAGKSGIQGGSRAGVAPAEPNEPPYEPMNGTGSDDRREGGGLVTQAAIDVARAWRAAHPELSA